MDDPSDAALIQRMQSGDPMAVADFYHRYLGVLWRYVRARTAQDADARDIVAETFLAALGVVAAIGPEVPAAAWLLGIARHKLADGHRRAGRQTRALQSLREAPSPETSAPVESADDLARLRQLLAAMPDDDRTILEWKYLEGLSVRQIAERTARSEKAVESSLFRARNALRDLFEPRPASQETKP